MQTPAGPPAAGADAGCAGKAYVDNQADGTVSVITMATGAVSAPIRRRRLRNGMAITPDGKHVYVTNGTPIALATHRAGDLAPDGSTYLPGIAARCR